MEGTKLDNTAMMEDKQTFLCFVGTYCILMAMKEGNCHVGLKTGEERGFLQLKQSQKKSSIQEKTKGSDS